MVSRHKTARAATALTALIGIGGSLAACGSSSKSSTATATSTVGGAGSATTLGGGSAVASAAAFTAKLERVPTSIPLTTPLKSKPPTGKTFVFLQCDVDQCTTESQALQTVTKAVGWNLKVIPYKAADPSTLISGLQQALQYGPAAVGLTGIPEAEYASVLPSYQKAGVPIVVGYVGPQKLDDTIIANIAGPSNAEENAKAIASYFVANSGGKGKALQFQVPDFPILNTFDTAFRADVSQMCPACSLTPLTGTIAEVTGGGATSAIISALQRDPSIGWVVTDEGVWVDGLPAAASNAGIHVKVVGQAADPVDETDIKNGTMTAFTGVALSYGEWAMIDAVLRHLEGMPIPPNEGDEPVQLFTQNSNFAVSNSFDEPADYASQMKALWHLS